ncbi:hypothetical protein BVRB_6g127840 [Beta vulgaris subsp. vulgaris]|nr:hypothetical protein BVRB_6g127840 [Beta vulgaris subsp. vulgaris]
MSKQEKKTSTLFSLLDSSFHLKLAYIQLTIIRNRGHFLRCGKHA